MKRKIIINEQKLKFYSVNQLGYSGKMISNFREEISDKETLVNYILEQFKRDKVDEVRWSCFLQELMYCIEVINIPENINELKEYYKDNNRIKINDQSVKDRCYIWVSDQFGDLKLCFVITEKEINCVTLCTKIESISEMCLIIDKILGIKR